MDRRTDTYNRARYYDPATGRWIHRDPLGFDAGDSNLYRYVNNGPTNGTDASGLDWNVEYQRHVKQGTLPTLKNGQLMTQEQFRTWYEFYGSGGSSTALPSTPGTSSKTPPSPVGRLQDQLKQLTVQLRSPQDFPVQKRPPPLDLSQVKLSDLKAPLLTPEMARQVYIQEWMARDREFRAATRVDPVADSKHMSGGRTRILADDENAQRAMEARERWNLSMHAMGPGASGALDDALAFVPGVAAIQALIEDWQQNGFSVKTIIYAGLGALDVALVLSPLRAGTGGAIRGTAQINRGRPLAINPGRVRRSVSEATELARKHGVEIGDDVQILARPRAGMMSGSETQAEYFSLSGRNVHDGQRFTWRDIAPDGRVRVRVRQYVFVSDEEIVAVLGHEMHEINALRARLQGRSISARDLQQLINAPDGILHQQALRVEEELRRRIRGAN